LSARERKEQSQTGKLKAIKKHILWKIEFTPLIKLYLRVELFLVDALIRNRIRIKIHCISRVEKFTWIKEALFEF